MIFIGLLSVFVLLTFAFPAIIILGVLGLLDGPQEPYPIRSHYPSRGENYGQPRGVCTYNNGAMTGCFCTAYRADPVVHIQNGYSTGAICAPRTRFLTCPSAQMLRTDSLITYVKIDGRCYVSCTGNRNCPWPSRCENNAVLGEVCFYPQWTD